MSSTLRVLCCTVYIEYTSSALEWLMTRAPVYLCVLYVWMHACMHVVPYTVCFLFECPNLCIYSATYSFSKMENEPLAWEKVPHLSWTLQLWTGSSVSTAVICLLKVNLCSVSVWCHPQSLPLLTRRPLSQLRSPRCRSLAFLPSLRQQGVCVSMFLINCWLQSFPTA